MPPDTAERRPRHKGGVPDDALAGGKVTITVTHPGCPCGCETRPPWIDDPDCVRHEPLTRGLEQALDHFHELGVCVCWVAGRVHERGAA